MGRNRSIAWELASGSYGYVRADEAVVAGIPPVELVKLARGGRLQHVAYGLYRFVEFPVSDRDLFFEAVARVGGDAHLTGDAVLHFHGLGLVNPPQVKVGTARRVRRSLPAWIALVHDGCPADQLTSYEGVASASVAWALAACRGELMGERFTAMVRTARDTGLITGDESRALGVSYAGV